MPYNVERILLVASNLDTIKVASIMEKFDSTRAVDIPSELLESVSDMITGISVRKGINKWVKTFLVLRNFSVTYNQSFERILDQLIVRNDEIIEVMNRCYEENKYVLCPHTAIGMMYHYKTKRKLK